MATRSAFFEIPADLTPEEKEIMKVENKVSIPRNCFERPKGGMSFDVSLNEDEPPETNLQNAAALLRERSEKRRSQLTAARQNSNQTTSSSEKPLTTDDLLTDDLNSQPSEAGTYTLRLDSADVRDRKILYDSMIEHNDEGEIRSEEIPRDQNSATESTEDYNVPRDVTDRVSEWFDRNDAAQSRQSDAKEENLEDIRQKAKERLEKCKEGKVVFTRESRDSRQQPSQENIRSKGSNPQIRMTRAMLLQRNRALGLDTHSKAKPTKPTSKPPAASSRKVSARLENLSKPRARGLPEQRNRARSFSQDEQKVGTGRGRKPFNPKPEKASDRSTSLTRSKTGGSMSISKPRISLDPKLSRPPTMSQSMREGRAVKTVSKLPTSRSTSLNRAMNLPKSRTPLPRNTFKTPNTPGSRPQTVSSSKPATSTSTSSSRPQTANSNIDKAHESSILYSMRILSNTCLQKSEAIIANLGGEEDFSLLKPSAGGDARPELEVLLANLCQLDQVLTSIQRKTSKLDAVQIETITVDSLAVTTVDEHPATKLDS